MATSECRAPPVHRPGRAACRRRAGGLPFGFRGREHVGFLELDRAGRAKRLAVAELNIVYFVDSDSMTQRNFSSVPPVPPHDH